MKTFYDIFKDSLSDKCGVKENSTVLVAVSGGADSMALLHLLLKTNCQCVVAHCNFALRGNESVYDEQFVSDTCKNLKIPFHAKQFDTQTFAKAKKISIEMAARQLRYKWFDQLSSELNIDYIATGHHGDDAIETFMLNLTRGTGIKGLIGIENQKGKIIRPLLFVSAEEIKKYCSDNKISYRYDSTNSENKFIRNKIRNQIIPLYKEINPSFFSTMMQNMEYLTDAYFLYTREIEKLIDKLVTTKEGITYILKQKLIAEPLKKSLLFELLHNKGFSPTMIDNINSALDKTSGKQFLTNTHRLIVDRNNLILTTTTKIDQKNYSIVQGTKTIEEPIRMNINIFHRTSEFKFSKNPLKAHFDADLIKFPLKIRRPISGDRFKPLGMNLFKKISDFFIDEKFDTIDKEQTWLLTTKTDIIYIIGKRIDNRYKVTKKTKKILEVEIEKL